MSRRHNFVSCCFALIVIIIVIAISLSLSAQNIEATSELHDKIQRPFRCFRPFSQLRAFAPKDMQSKENCDFAPFLSITDAKAEVTCKSSSGCSVNVSFVGHRYDMEGKSERNDGDEDIVDSARYTLELRAIGASSVKYNGFDDTGYSVCCAMLNEAECEWITVVNSTTSTSATTTKGDEEKGEEEENNNNSEKQQEHKEQVVKHCALHDDDYKVQIEDGRRVLKEISGSISKPLHRRVVGDWEAKIEFYRGTTKKGRGGGVGRLVIPFHLSEEQVSLSEMEAESEAVVSATV